MERDVNRVPKRVFAEVPGSLHAELFDVGKGEGFEEIARTLVEFVLKFHPTTSKGERASV